MFHPVGSQSPSVYWRRRLVLLAFLIAAVVLVVLSVNALGSSGGTPAAAPGTGSTTAPGTVTTHSSPNAPRTHGAGQRKTAVQNTADPASGSTSPGAPSSLPPVRCTRSQLAVAAVTNHSSYSVGDQPVLMLQVTDKGPQPCVQDLADRQVVLRVYNGESRVWGSHDCKIEPGTSERTLEVDRPVRVSIVWSGLSSEAHCAGTRQRVGAGTYTLYATLSGKTGTATQFTIS